MLIRVLGIVVVLLASCGLGFRISYELIDRIEDLQQIKRVLIMLRGAQAASLYPNNQDSLQNQKDGLNLLEVNLSYLNIFFVPFEKWKETYFHHRHKLIATIHGSSIEDIRRKPILQKLLQERIFERYIVMNKGMINPIFLSYIRHYRICAALYLMRKPNIENSNRYLRLLSKGTRNVNADSYHVPRSDCCR